VVSDQRLPIDNDDDEDIRYPQDDEIVVYSRDWTVQTIVSQIEQGNIDLNPKFQRRNAWKDDKRIRLVESLMLKYPVPEIVIAERKDRKRSYIVIDGKQRLQTLAGIYLSDDYKIWSTDHFTKSELIPELTKVPIKSFIGDPAFSDQKRVLDNADVRCTIISSYRSEDVLYDIFFRLNTGSSPLSSQELRQVLNKGQFSEYLVEFTNSPQPIHKVIEIEKADDRLMDADLLLRCLAFFVNGKSYRGNQRQFLDDFVRTGNKDWDSLQTEIVGAVSTIMDAIDFLGSLIGYNKIGRKIKGNEFDWRFNKVLFEVQVLFATHLKPIEITDDLRNRYRKELEELLESNYDFRQSIEATTKSLERYSARYSAYGEFARRVFGTAVTYIFPEW
jgi:hypothetical protein